MAKHAAVTIVSKNYFALAKTLAASYKHHHPDDDFIIVLVDRADGFVDKQLACGAEVIEIASIAVPDLTRFIYRYSIMELNTAVKPFVLSHLLEKNGYETVLYIDPDILIFQPLRDIKAALDSASIVLIPHMRRPMFDNALPSDLEILRSGTYNLGFLGLRKGKSAAELLDWWMRKLYVDCVVDIAKGLFVDQKWIDLVPGFFPDHKIIYSPAYNAAYWNLHERVISEANGVWQVDDEPLAFFHFSGYTPFEPNSLSKHQNRHDLRTLPDLHKLTNEYGELLLTNGYEESCTWLYAFEKLGNGVSMPLLIVRNVMQWAARNNIATPCPIEEPDNFCRFLMSRNIIADRPNAVLLFHFLLELRPDVAAAYPGVTDNHDDVAFRGWVAHSGVNDYKFEDLLKFEKTSPTQNIVADAFSRLRTAKQHHVFEKFKDMWVDPDSFTGFAKWFTSPAAKQLGFLPAHSDALTKSAAGAFRILNIYFMRGDLQLAFPVLWETAQIQAFASWLERHRHSLELSLDAVALFTEYALATRQNIEFMRVLYFHQGRKRKTAPNMYSVDSRRFEVACVLDTAAVRDFLIAEEPLRAADQYLFHRHGEVESGVLESIPDVSPRENFVLAKRIKAELGRRESATGRVNMAGYLSAPSGMGESARSMAATLAATPLQVRSLTLPHPDALAQNMPNRVDVFGWPMSAADVSIAVVNADAVLPFQCFAPAPYWAKRNVGYWVWETESLPTKFKDAAKDFDEIWTPSEYAATAIRRCIDKPVHVLPHTLNFPAIAAAVANRKRFWLPEKSTLFGFMFDPRSVLERKNVAGLVKAFLAAFRNDDDCYLVLKANGSATGAYDYEMIRASTDSDRILFIEDTLGRDDTFSFLKSLDVYVSLHRAEGFGLTCAEAMALGLPVIASNYSGNLAFMTESNSILVPTSTVTTMRPYGAYTAGTRWGEPNAEAAAQSMRAMLDEGKRRFTGAAGKKDVFAMLDPSHIGDLAGGLIKSLMDRPGQMH